MYFYSTDKQILNSLKLGLVWKIVWNWDLNEKKLGFYLAFLLASFTWFPTFSHALVARKQEECCMWLNIGCNKYIPAIFESFYVFNILFTLTIIQRITYFILEESIVSSIIQHRIRIVQYILKGEGLFTQTVEMWTNIYKWVIKEGSIVNYLTNFRTRNKKKIFFVKILWLCQNICLSL